MFGQNGFDRGRRTSENYVEDWRRDGITDWRVCCGLTIYDMLKPVDESLAIESIKLLAKSGGMKDFYEKYSKPLKAVVIVISDSVSKGERPDKSRQACC